ncbi:hypothetical protein [uncultured Bdellovibrio sp.]|uniref:hypothetical protein n=1 Tax=Bdellovibrio sp. HCB-162 TaxID=3394234 RepID=UPI0025FC5E53|nr:hypothetical protein [uncultured Bdellovibrio sp.]
MNKLILGILVLICGAVTANAHPVSFQGAVSLMSYNKEKENELLLTYSFDRQWAVGLNYFKMENFEFTIPRINFLAKRWNNDDSQGNIYLSAGYGSDRSYDEIKGVALGSVEADWESRKYYTSIQYNKFFRQDSDKADRTDYEHIKGRLGVAPYLAEFSELNTWLIVQFDKENDKAIETTQFIRMFYKNAMIELGATIGGGWAFNYMVHF